MTARVHFDHVEPEVRSALRLLNDRVMRYCPRTGDLRWETAAWDSIRSDSHQITFRVGSDAFWLQGSPARVCGDGDAVFGSGASAALDLVGCLHRMVAFTSGAIGHDLPQAVTCWDVSRIDVTESLVLDSLADVRVALRLLRECEGGRYRVSQQAGDTVYWSHRSRVRSGKAYAKGPHLEYMVGKPNYSGRVYTLEELDQANRLLRLELKIGAQFLREKAGKHWYQIDANELRKYWNEYFMRMLGGVEMNDENNLMERLKVASKTEGQARAAYGCFLLIQAQGWEKAREAHSKPTWYRHLKLLHAAGLGDADISAGKVIPFRRKVLEACVVNSWQELKAAA
jgi:II/X family phage/plasmid replication protein